MQTANTHLETIKRNLGSLTSREWDVLLLVAEDISNNEIADRLHLTTESVKTYRARISDKLIISGRDSLARFARKNGPFLRDMHVELYSS